MAYTYIQSEHNEFGGLWTVGDYGGGKWNPESDHDNKEEAADRVRYLNGGNTLTPVQQAAPELLEALELAYQLIKQRQENTDELFPTFKAAINKAKGL